MNLKEYFNTLILITQIITAATIALIFIHLYSERSRSLRSHSLAHNLKQAEKILDPLMTAIIVLTANIFISMFTEEYGGFILLATTIAYVIWAKAHITKEQHHDQKQPSSND